jgi:hypothetical protein
MEEFGHGSRLQRAMFEAKRYPDAEAVEAVADTARSLFVDAT